MIFPQPLQLISHYPITIMQFVPVCLSRAKDGEHPAIKKAEIRRLRKLETPYPTFQPRRAGDPSSLQGTTAARSLGLLGECPLASSPLRQRLPSPATSPPSPLLKTPKFPHFSTPFPLLPRSHPWPPPAPGSGAEPAIAGSLPGLLPAVALPARFYWARRGIPSHLGAFTGGAVVDLYRRVQRAS